MKAGEGKVSRVFRLEYQVRRLRDRLADAIAQRRPRRMIKRLEEDLSRRWELLDHARQAH
jgi:hypothetical protein